MARPGLGVLIKGSGSLRKVRWAPAHQARAAVLGSSTTGLYGADRILMLLIYSKTERDDLTSAQLQRVEGDC